MNTKNNQTNASKNLGKLPTWNLKDLYLSQNDKGLSFISFDFSKNIATMLL